MKMTKETKDLVQVISAMAMLVSGVTFGAAGFAVPPVGQIHDSVLWIAAQCFIYSGTAMGISYYVRKSNEDLRRELGIKNRNEDTD